MQIENSKISAPRSKSKGFASFALLALLWVGFGFGLKSAWAICTPFWTQFGITFVNGEQAQNATNTNYYYWNYCTLLLPATGNYTPASTLTWTTTTQTAQFKDSWNCTYDGQYNLYFPSNCSWGSNITAFWNHPPQCTLTAQPSSITAGDSVQLTATCTAPGTSTKTYTWTNTSFASTASSGTVSPTTDTTYTVKASNISGPGNTASVTVTVTAPAKPACTLTANPTSINLGDSSTLTASCTPTPTSYSWGNSVFSSSTSSGSVSPTATTNYSVSGINITGTGTAASAQVTVNPLTEITSTTQVNASALSMNRATGKYFGTITVTNTGSTFSGPLYVFFNNLPAGVTLPTLPTFGGAPYLTIPGGLASGATSTAVGINFTDPTNARISYTTKRFKVTGN